MKEQYAVKILGPSKITGQSIMPLGILIVEAFGETDAVIEAVKLCAKYYYENIRYNKEDEIPSWLLKYYLTDYHYGTAFRNLNYQVLT